MELRQLKARLDLLDTMVEKMDASPARKRGIKRTVFVLRAFLKLQTAIPTVYGPDVAIAQFSLQ